MSRPRRLNQIYPDDPTAVQPLGIRLDDTVYGQLTGSGPDLPSQVASVSGRLRELVRRSGARLENVARCVAYVTVADHRSSVEAMWNQLFPEAPDSTASKVVVGVLEPEQLLQLDVLALVGGRRERLDVPAGHCVHIGNWVCSSPLAGPDVATLMRTIAETARSVEAAVCRVTTYGPNVKDAARAFESAFPDASRRPGFQAFVTSDRCTADFTAMRDSAGDGPRGQTMEELFIGSEPVSSGVKLGELVYAPHLTGTDPTTHSPAGPATYEQVDMVLDNVDRLMGVAGGGRGQIARVNVYMTDVMEKYATLNPLWQARFPDPDDRPPHTYLPARLPGGQRVGAQVFGLLAASRTSLYIDGMAHGDPMTLAAVIGNMVFAARISAGRGESRDAIENAGGMFHNVNRVLSQVGGDLHRVQEGLVTLHDPTHRAAVQERWAELVPGSDDRLRYIDWNLGRGVLMPRIQITAIL